MTTILATTLIDAPILTCFRISLSIDAEASAEQAYKLRAVAGVTHGEIGPGETVTWRVRQFGLWITHTTLISAYDAPAYFQDRMIKGLFRTFIHDHFFRAITPHQTEMHDELSFSMPMYLGGPIADRVILKRRITHMLANRNSTIKRLAETTTWGLSS